MKFSSYIGETSEYEKKEAVEKRKVKSWLKTVIAFSNGNGGTLFFGVADDDEIVGLENIKEDSEFISQKIKERIDPVPQTAMEFESVEGKNVLLLRVFGGSDTPYYYIGDGTMETFVRIGNESVTADAAEQKRLVLQGKNSTWDTLTSEFLFADFSFSKLRERFRVWAGTSFEEKMFHSFGIVTPEGFLTNTGALLADESPVYQSRLFCTRWNGLTKSGGIADALDSQELCGSLILMLNDGLGFIRRNMRKKWYKTSDSRVELPDYVERSFQEALVNALVHRDYLIRGSEIHVDIYDDRMTIYSPGGMPDGRNIQDVNLRTVPSVRRNPLLADVFNRLGYMERQGSGLSKILDGCKNAENFTKKKAPVFYSSHSEFTLCFWNMNYGVNEHLNELLNTLPEEQILQHTLDVLRTKPQITQIEIAELLGVSHSKIRRTIQNAITEGKLQRIGSRKTGSWKVLSPEPVGGINGTLNEPLNEHLNEPLDKKIIHILKLRPHLNQSQMAQILEVSLSAIRRELGKLVQNGLVQYVGSKKTGYWNVIKTD